MKSILKTARYIANRIRLALSALPIQCRYRKKISELKRRRVIRVAFLLSGDTGIQFERLLKLMCDDSLFAPSIVVVPAYGYGVIDPIGRMRAAEESLRKRFGDLVMCSYNGEGFVDIKKHFDICFTTSVYDWQMHANYRIKTMARSGVLVAATSYYFDNGTIHNKIYTIIPALSYLWRFYSTTDNMKKEIQCHHKVLAAFGGVKVSGMPRLDGLVNVPVVERKRKKVLICPHHSVIEQPGLHLSNFLRYSELIQELPTRYPQIDWTFRPHPLLKGVLIKNNIWSESDWDSYLNRLTAHGNLVYKPTGSVLDEFVNSDAMIQDCGSFIPEYHCTYHPQCYVLKDEGQLRLQFMPWGRELLANAYTAFSPEDIFSFIDEVVLRGNDYMKEERKRFVDEKLLINYPNINEWILKDVKATLGKTNG